MMRIITCKHKLFITAILSATVLSCSDVSVQNHEITGKPIELKEPVTVNWIGQWKNEGLKEKLVKDIARQFEFENPDIKVNLQFPQDIFVDVPNEIRYYYSIITAEKSEWDLLRINDGAEELSSYSSDPDFLSKNLVDFKNDKEFIANHIPGAFKTIGFNEKWNNIIPGTALDGADGVLWCNMEVAKEIGIEPKQFGMTFDDFKSYLKALYEYNQKNNTNIIGILDVTSWTLFNMIPQQLFQSEVGNYESLIDGQFSTQKWNAFEKTVRALASLAPYQPVEKNVSYSWDTDKIVPLQGKCLFYPQASYCYNLWLEMDSLAESKMRPMQLPEFKPSVSYPGVYAIQWIIPQNSPHKEQAIRLMKFIATPEVGDKWVRYAKSPSGVKNTLVSTRMGMDPYENYDYTITSKFGEHKVPWALTTNWFLGDKNSNISLNFKSLLTGEITADDFIKQVKSKLK
ncbi:MAG: ABC transporter substrate-binding protein [Bacteroidales bacterium]